MTDHTGRPAMPDRFLSPCHSFLKGSGLRKNALARIFRVQLKTNLLCVLTMDAQRRRCFGEMVAEFNRHPLETLGDLLVHPRPPLSLLYMAKEYAKHAHEAAVEPLPADVAVVIYFAIIAVAILRHGSRITALNTSDLQEGLRWTQRQPWLDSAIQVLAANALNMTKCESEHS